METMDHRYSISGDADRQTDTLPSPFLLFPLFVSIEYIALSIPSVNQMRRNVMNEIVIRRIERSSYITASWWLLIVIRNWTLS